MHPSRSSPTGKGCSWALKALTHPREPLGGQRTRTRTWKCGPVPNNCEQRSEAPAPFPNWVRAHAEGLARACVAAQCQPLLAWQLRACGPSWAPLHCLQGPCQVTNTLGLTFFDYEVMTLPACLHRHCPARIKQFASAQPRWPSKCLGVSGALGTGPRWGSIL